MICLSGRLNISGDLTNCVFECLAASQIREKQSKKEEKWSQEGS
jgi:hypothetical protein